MCKNRIQHVVVQMLIFFPSATIDFLFNIVLAKYYDHSKSRNIF